MHDKRKRNVSNIESAQLDLSESALTGERIDLTESQDPNSRSSYMPRSLGQRSPLNSISIG